MVTPATVVEPSAALPSVLAGFSSVACSPSPTTKPPTGTSSIFWFSSSAMLFGLVVVGGDDIMVLQQRRKCSFFYDWAERPCTCLCCFKALVFLRRGGSGSQILAPTDHNF